jgi:hypothetical protein
MGLMNLRFLIQNYIAEIGGFTKILSAYNINCGLENRGGYSTQSKD